ncbi:MAG: DUF3618 domain-containing protein [Propionibacteriaceae bacterium]|jgi:predicted nuclease with RNAse H fold|nr:DUF3618 domain-containing protein [Propionibacteriaceae bacterium]
MADERSVADIERDLAATRQRLVENISQLVYETHPKAVTHRTVEEGKRRTRAAVAQGKAKLRQSIDWVKSQFHDESGWNVRNLAIAGAVVVTVVVLATAGKKK